eukprot:3428925-Rhodomonas_salina.2
MGARGEKGEGQRSRAAVVPSFCMEEVTCCGYGATPGWYLVLMLRDGATRTCLRSWYRTRSSTVCRYQTDRPQSKPFSGQFVPAMWFLSLIPDGRASLLRAR